MVAYIIVRRGGAHQNHARWSYGARWSATRILVRSFVLSIEFLNHALFLIEE
jgi:hypothetical protein